MKFNLNWMRRIKTEAIQIICVQILMNTASTNMFHLRKLQGEYKYQEMSCKPLKGMNKSKQVIEMVDEYRAKVNYPTL